MERQLIDNRRLLISERDKRKRAHKCSTSEIGQTDSEADKWGREAAAAAGDDASLMLLLKKVLLVMVVVMGVMRIDR